MRNDLERARIERLTLRTGVEPRVLVTMEVDP